MLRDLRCNKNDALMKLYRILIVAGDALDAIMRNRALDEEYPSSYSTVSTFISLLSYLHGAVLEVIPATDNRAVLAAAVRVLYLSGRVDTSDARHAFSALRKLCRPSAIDAPRRGLVTEAAPAYEYYCKKLKRYVAASDSDACFIGIYWWSLWVDSIDVATTDGADGTDGRRDWAIQLEHANRIWPSITPEAILAVDKLEELGTTALASISRRFRVG
jgi:hypothetical protein